MELIMFMAGVITTSLIFILYFTIIDKAIEKWVKRKLDIEVKLDMVSNDFISRINTERALAKPVDVNTIWLITNTVRENQQIEHLNPVIYSTFIRLTIKHKGKKREVRVNITPDKFE